MHLNIFGIQGSGKGTQAELLKDKFGYTLFQPGRIFRTLSQEDSDLGRELLAIMKSGKLVSNQLISDVLEDFLSKHQGEKILFDGVPRNTDQETMFNALVKKLDMPVKAIQIILDENKVMDRLLKRIESEGRADDNEAAIKERLSIFKNETMPVINNYETAGNLIKINGDQSIEKVHQDIIKAIQN